MNQPTTPNTVEDFLPLPEKGDNGYRASSLDGGIRHQSYSAAQMRAYVLADRAQRLIEWEKCVDLAMAADWMQRAIKAEAALASPTVAGSVDTPEFRKLMWDNWQGYGMNEGKRECIAYIDNFIAARLAPAAPSGEAVHQVELDAAQGTWLDVAGHEVDTWRRKKFVVRTLAHPAPSSPTAPGLPAQAVPAEDWKISPEYKAFLNDPNGCASGVTFSEWRADKQEGK